MLAYRVIIFATLMCCGGAAYPECEDVLVRDAVRVHSRDDIRTAVFDSINEQNYQSANTNGQLSALIPEADLLAGAKFSELQSKQTSFSRQYGYFFRDISALDYASTRLSALGYAAYAECVKSQKPGIRAYVSALGDDSLLLHVGFVSFLQATKAFNVVITASGIKEPIKVDKPIPGGASVEVQVPRDPKKTILITVNSDTDAKGGEVGSSDKVTVPKDITPDAVAPPVLDVSGSFGYDRGSGHCKDNSDPEIIANLCKGKSSCTLQVGPSLCRNGLDPSPGDPKTLHLRYSCGMQSGNRDFPGGFVVLGCPPLSVATH